MRWLAALLLLAQPGYATRIKTRVAPQGPGVAAPIGTTGASLTPPQSTLDLAVPTLNGQTLYAAPSARPVHAPQAAVGAAAAEPSMPRIASPAPTTAIERMQPAAQPPDAGDAPAVGGKALRREMRGQRRQSAATEQALESGDIGAAAAAAGALFDGMQIADPQGIREIDRLGADRGGPYRTGGREVAKIGGGQFKTVLEVPGDPDHVLALFDNVVPGYASRLTPAQLAEDVTYNSRSERDRELRKRAPLVRAGVAPRRAKITRLRLNRQGRADTIAGYYVERVVGGEVWKMGEEDLRLVRRLFDELIAKRIYWGAEPGGGSPTGLDPKLVENIMIGTTKSDGRRRAWIVDADSNAEPPKYSKWDALRGKPDPLREHYHRLYRELRRQWLQAGGYRAAWQREQLAQQSR